MVFDTTPLMCPFNVESDIFTLKKDTSKMHYNNARLNVPDNASLVVYQATLAEHWLFMGFKTDMSHVDTRLSKMEVAIENITSFAAVGNLVVNQLIERKVATVVTPKAASVEEPKWSTIIVKNVR
jgi:hypothetical protein